jgi:excisionase family DNA binding protein
MREYHSSSPNEHQKSLMDERQLAELLGIKPDTIRKWRVFKKGPRAIKIGHLVRCQMADVEAWIAACPEIVTGSQ